MLLFIDQIGNGLTVPILPSLFLNAQYGLLAHASVHQRNFLLDISLALFPLASIIGNFYLGGLSDIRGRRQTIILGFSFYLFSYLLSMFSVIIHSVILYLFARLIAGFGSGTYAIASVSLIDISESDSEKLKYLKYPALAGILGVILGPGFSLFMNKVNSSLALVTPFIIAFCFGVLNLVLLILFFPRIKAEAKVENKSISSQIKLTSKVNILKQVFNSAGFIFKQKQVRYLLISYFLFVFAWSLFCLALPFILNNKFSYLPSQISVFFLVVASLYAVSMLFIFHIINKYVLDKWQIYISLWLLITLFCGLMSFLYYTKINVSINAIWSITMCMFMILPFMILPMQKNFSNAVNKTEQGKMMGGISSIYACAGISSSFLVGLANTSPNLLLLIIIIILLFSLLLARRHWK